MPFKRTAGDIHVAYYQSLSVRRSDVPQIILHGILGKTVPDSKYPYGTVTTFAIRRRGHRPHESHNEACNQFSEIHIININHLR